jgi:hypothetical protein
MFRQRARLKGAMEGRVRVAMAPVADRRAAVRELNADVIAAAVDIRHGRPVLPADIRAAEALQAERSAAAAPARRTRRRPVAPCDSHAVADTDNGCARQLWQRVSDSASSSSHSSVQVSNGFGATLSDICVNAPKEPIAPANKRETS